MTGRSRRPSRHTNHLSIGRVSAEQHLLPTFQQHHIAHAGLSNMDSLDPWPLVTAQRGLPRRHHIAHLGVKLLSHLAIHIH